MSTLSAPDNGYSMRYSLSQITLISCRIQLFYDKHIWYNRTRREEEMHMVFNKINMSHTLKQIISAVLMIVLILSSGLMPAYAAGKAKRSSFKYKKYAEHEKYRKALFWRMNAVYNTISDYMDDDNTLPIPGLVKTYSLFKGKGQLSKQFVPQGICRAGRFCRSRPFWPPRGPGRARSPCSPPVSSSASPRAAIWYSRCRW